MEINKKLTPYNYTSMSNKKNEYIVIHYVGSESTAKNNADYFANNKVQASAHYFVDSNEIWQSVEDKNSAWHCGGGLQGNNGHSFYGKCKNSNSIGIEMCCFKDGAGRWFFTDATVKNTVELVKELMKKYNIPVDRVIRHYDVTGKNCPAPYVNEKEWQNFKSKLISKPILETGNDIVWELMNGKHKIKIAEVERAIKALDKAKNNSEFTSLYWILYKLVNENG